MMYIKEININLPASHNDLYYFGIPAIKNTRKVAFTSPLTFFVGENGSGKSTMLEAIASKMNLNTEGGSKNFLFSTKETVSSLSDHILLSKSFHTPRDSYFLRAESFYNLATEIDILEDEAQGLLEQYGEKSLHEQSHGESFLSLIQNRFWGHGFYLLDEPEAALSPQNQITLMILMHRLIADGSQLIVATHSPILLGYPDAQILSFDDTISSIMYEDTESYKTTELFINHRDYITKRLFFDENTERSEGLFTAAPSDSDTPTD